MKKILAIFAASILAASVAHAVIYGRPFDSISVPTTAGVTNTANLYGELVGVNVTSAGGHTATVAVVYNGQTLISKSLNTATTNLVVRNQIVNSSGTPIQYVFSPGAVAEGVTNTVPSLEPFPLGGSTTITVTGGANETTTNTWNVKLLLRQ